LNERCIKVIGLAVNAEQKLPNFLLSLLLTDPFTAKSVGGKRETSVFNANSLR
jgi:hypothetical protein